MNIDRCIDMRNLRRGYLPSLVLRVGIEIPLLICHIRGRGSI